MVNTSIYIDVLILINLFVNFFLLKSTQSILHLPAKQYRIVISSFLGGVYSLIILVDMIPILILNILKLVMSLILVLIAFGYKNKKQTFKTLLFFYIINFIYAGIMIGIYFFINPVGMVYQNGIAYFDISAILLCICTIISYLIIQLISYLLSKNTQKNQIMSIQVQINNSSLLLNAFIDTGNQLVDIMTSLPIIMCETKSVKSIFSDEIYNLVYDKKIEMINNKYWNKKLKLIFVTTVTGSNMLVGFKADKVICIKENEKVEKQAIIALTNDKISNGEFDALIGTNIL